MTAATPLAFPPGRVLAEWRRQLSWQEPSTLWIGYLRVHRLEALARTAREYPLDPLQSSLLQVLALMPARVPAGGSAVESRGTDLATLHQWLGLDSALLRRMLAHAAKEGLVAAADSPDQDGHPRWHLTSTGSHAVAIGRYASQTQERRIFHFLSAIGPPPRHEFVNILTPDYLAAASDPPSLEEPKTAPTSDALAACIAQTPKWKEDRGFPAEIVEIVSPTQAESETRNGKSSLHAWQGVMVSRFVQGLFLFVREARQLRAFVVKPEGWRIQANPACLVLRDGDWQPLVPAIMEEPSVEMWRAAWIAWGQAHSLPDPDVRNSEVSSEGHHLRVRVGKRLLERLRASRSEALAGETWLWAGDGPFRALRVLDIVEP